METEIHILEKIIALADAEKTAAQMRSNDLCNETLPRRFGLSPTAQALFAAIDALTPGQKYELLAVAWLGRDYERANSFESWVSYAAQTFEPEHVADYLVGKGPLARYLRDGLAMLAQRR